MKSTPSRSRQVAFWGIMLALAMVASYIESLIPFYFGVPGMKLGLANAIVVVFLYVAGPREALLINLMRILLTGFLFGNAFSIAYSLAGGVLSFVFMVLARRSGRFSVVGVSVAGGFSHNIGQLLLAAVIVENYRLGYYGPVLMVCGVVTGFLIGILAAELIPRLSFIKETNKKDF